MKRLVTALTFLLILSFFGCSIEDSVNAPINESAQKQIVQLPASSNQLFKNAVFSEKIDGTVGGELEFNFHYTTTEGKTVAVKGHLTVPAGAFNYTTEIKAVVNSDLAVVDFYPSASSFEKALLLDLRYEGLNLNKNYNSADFYYISNDGQNFENIPEDSKAVDLNKGSLEVDKARLEHFSRFGWAI